MTAHLVELAKASLEAHKKYNHNANKVTFMSMTKPGRFAFEQYGDQLEAMRVSAKEATAKWTDAAKGLSTEEIVSIMQEALK